ncbi:N-acetyltransferase [Agromyces rhizosphaerae]|uniref:N-acetyltransferase n=1 Tax=Agromyces rhizosphaerae TaxID=88374 RepID=A0A9W6CW05_9MICO|nr:GNAT family N-acetyltransferase [Agromyces rhizosphaerae]GLI26720.1 N-acetyltransferase [Agromyces rhizosphaerae]
MTIEIRRAGRADAASLAELAAETFPLACPPHTTPASIAAFIAEHFTVARFEEHLADPARILLIAEDVAPEPAGDALAPRRVPVGYAMLVTGEPADADVLAAVTARPTIELSKFYTRRTVHGAGVAAPLMGATIAAAEATGAATAWLGVNEENARAIRFYGKHGFARVGTKRFRVGERLEHDLVLERVLGGDRVSPSA